MSTKLRTEAEWRCLTIRAGGGKRVTEDGLTRYRYIVSVKSDATGARIRFDFTDSAHNYSEGVTTLDRSALLEAFYCFVSDASAGEETFGDFVGDFGYDSDSYSAHRIHEACKRALVKFGRLWHDKREPSTILDALQAEGIG